MKTQNKDEQFWKQFEAEDRRRYPAQWAIHDNMMNQSKQRESAVRTTLTKGLLVVVLILLAIVITTT
jgi:hypothetical protein